MYRDSIFDGDADIEQAELEAAGRAAGRGRRHMLALRAQGKPAEAAACCHHGAGYPTNAPAAEHSRDPRAGQGGHRCTNCGSFWNAAQIAPIADRFGVQLSALRRMAPIAPCELPPQP